MERSSCCGKPCGGSSEIKPRTATCSVNSTSTSTPSELEVGSHTGTRTPMFTAALFTSQKLEASHASADGAADAENVTCPCDVILLHPEAGKRAFGQRAPGVPTHSRAIATQRCNWHPGAL